MSACMLFENGMSDGEKSTKYVFIVAFAGKKVVRRSSITVVQGITSDDFGD